MKKALIELLKVKTIITLAITFCLAYGFITNKIETDVFMPIVTMIFTFYFAKKEIEKGE